MPTAKSAGYVKIRAEECMLPHGRRTTYETINDEDEGVYTHIASERLEENGMEEQAIQSEKDSSHPETPELTEGRLMMIEMQKHIESALKVQSFPAARPVLKTQRRNSTKRVFGPQHPDCDPNKETSFTPTERRLSGIIRAIKFVDPHMTEEQRKLDILKSAQSLPNVAFPESPKNSGSSGYKSEGGSPNHNNTSDSEYGYTTITQLMTPRPLKERRLGHVPHNTSEIPKQCFNAIDIPVYDYDDDTGNFKEKRNLFETRYYLNSIVFMRSFADIFSDKLAAPLGFTSGLKSATLQGTKIYCDTTNKGHDSRPVKIRTEIIPTIFSAIWPKEALKWKTRTRNRVSDPRADMVYTWPTQSMLKQVHSLGCHLLPLGYMPTRGRNNEQYLEWQLAFPEAERYLETWLTHSQVRCLLFSLALYKSFLEPLNVQLGLLPTHIRTLLFWQCERNYAAWPEDRPGETLRKLLEKLYEAIMQKNLPDYFIPRRNLFESTPRTHLLKVQEKLLRIRENLVMHTLSAVRNLRYVDKSFYPVFDCKRLYQIITTDNLVTLLNPLLQQPTLNTVTPKIKQNAKDEEDDEEFEEEADDSNIDLWKPVISKDPRKRWKQDVRAQIETERAALKLAKSTAPKPRRPSTDSIDIKLQSTKGADEMRKMALLEFFIPHFIDIAKKSNSFRATRQARFYLQHTERLIRLLRECDGGESKAWKYSFETKTLREAIGEESTYTAGSSSGPFRGASPRPADSTATFAQTKKEQCTGDMTQAASSQGEIFKTANPFRVKMELPTNNLHSILKKPVILNDPLPYAKNSKQQSLSKTNITTVATVHEPIRNKMSQATPRYSPSPPIRFEVTGSPPLSSTVVLNEAVTAESTDF
ncbi:uncharacterized protein LOC110834913 isoform X2 [Zootermopsis nevadensis]|uniref:uncharacterized protein LOC110834913 isoform X2 n=1 Tax=Zootermopsis nevadensis TaxID=136037 RepID=UPI000B8EB3ED|nr:uncharacterized protein LOC110834913 isoform X2 [Zootermopsis nevadensis]